MRFHEEVNVDARWYDVTGIWTAGDPRTWRCAPGDPAREDDEVERIDCIRPIGADVIVHVQGQIERAVLRKLRADLDHEFEERRLEDLIARGAGTMRRTGGKPGQATPRGLEGAKWSDCS